MKQSLQSKSSRPADRSREFYTVSDLSDMLQIEKVTVYRMIRRNVIPVHRIGRAYRFRKSDVEEFLARCRSVEQTPVAS